MKYPVRLFLGNEEVEFSTPPAILFNYSETELTNPTIVKNSYSKTITIEGTQQNNRIFGHIYNMERMQDYNGNVMGSSFNPLVKTDFTLYYNGSIYESGYFKLDEVRRNDNNIEYDITLYGGLGDFFYNLSFREDGNAMELSDLTYWYEKWSGNELGFAINKEAVRDAWSAATHNLPATIWNTINFAPCYNGIPGNLSADRVLINNSGVTDYTPTLNVKTYSMGITSENLTEWETFDLRSYLQRPVINVEEIIGACCDPTNNGGYTVNLDQSFFNIENPYYYNAWMTLPLLTELDVPATVASALTVTAITKEQEFLYNVYSGLANASNVSFDMKIKFNPSDGYSGNSIYLVRGYTANGGVTLQNRFAKEYSEDSNLLIQMVGLNSSGQIAAESNMFYVYTPRDKGFRFGTNAEWFAKTFGEMEPETTVPGVERVIGKFTKVNGEYIFTDMEDNEQILHFTFPSDAEFSSLKLKIVPYVREYTEYTFHGGTRTTREAKDIYVWSEQNRHSSSWQDATTVRELNKVQGSVTYVPVGVTGITESFDGFYSGRYYSKKDLLTLGVSPAQFLLSYAKLYGLYFVKDVESKTIDILTRHNFYKRNEIVNINDLVDKGSDIKITPASPKYQYYDFALEQVESEAGKQYRNTYGNDYGAAIVNTGYQYEKEHKKVLDDNIFKGAINVLEKDKYYLKPIWGSSSTLIYNGPTYVNNGFKYWYILSENNTDEFDKESKPMTGETINPDGLRFYDVFPKPQFHDAENQATDGSMVLLFQNGEIDMSGIGYHITDDTTDMYTMNSQQPCWIMTRGTNDRQGTTIALDVSTVPVFSRDIYNGKYITASWDMGSPLATYVPNKYVSSWQGIYSKGWKSYISDLFNVNTRVLTCRCLLRERPNPEWLRRFYWFDNSYWRLNNIRDWNISSFDTTEMEFIKVQDIADYDNVEFSNRAVIEWDLEKYTAAASGETITGYINVSNGAYIYTDDEYYPISVQYSGETTGTLGEYSDYMAPTAAQGSTRVPVTLTIPANPSGVSRTITFKVVEGAQPTENVWPVSIVQDRLITGATATISILSATLPEDSGTLTIGNSITDDNNHGWRFEGLASSATEDWVYGYAFHTGASDYTQSGVGSYRVIYAWKPNEGPARSKTFTFRDTALNTTSAITLTQSSGSTTSASVSPTGFTVSTTAQTDVYAYCSNPKSHIVRFTSNNNWIKLYPFHEDSYEYETSATSSGVQFRISANQGPQRTGVVEWIDTVTSAQSTCTIVQSGVPWSAYFNFTYGDVTFPQSGMWDNYIIYSGATMDPIEDGGAIIMFNGGIIAQAGDTWNPASATGWEVYSPFSEKQQYNQVYIPQSLAGQTIYLMAEFGSADVGYALESQAIPVTIPQNGGQVNVTIPQF